MPNSTPPPSRSSVSEHRRSTVRSTVPNRDAEAREGRSTLVSTHGRVESHQTWYAAERPSITLPPDPV